MTKYIKVDWPDYQIYMEHPRFNECYYLTEDDSYMIPENIFDEDTSDALPETIYYDGMAFDTNSDYKKGDLLLFGNDKGDKWTSHCLAIGAGSMPDIFEHNETPGIGSFILGVQKK